MSFAGDSENLLLKLPWDVIDAGPWISIDIGGSVVKVLYLHKDDYIEPNNRVEGKPGQLRLVNFARERMTEAFEFMKNNALIKRKSPDETISIYTTGIGGSQFGKQITAELNVRRENIAETDCFQQAFLYLLRNISRLEALHEMEKPLFDKAKKDSEKMLEMFKKFSAMTDTMGNLEIKKPDPTYPQEAYFSVDEPLHAQKDIYPAMMMICGSGMGGMVIEENGTCQAGIMLPMGGRMFLGMGCLLTRAKTYEELMELCEKGVAKNVGITNHQLSEGWDATEENNMYSTITEFDEMVVFFFGHTVGKTIDDFRREDLARCLLEFVVKDLVNTTHMSCREADASTVFFTGGFVNHPLVRKLITQEWLNLDGTFAGVQLKEGAKQKNRKRGIHFLKHGSHLGAFGAYLNSKLHFCDHHGAAAATS